jgi:hypothetical protein
MSILLGYVLNNTNFMYYSYNSIDWKPIPDKKFSSQEVRSVKYNGKIWVAVSGNGIGYSYNGINWILKNENIEIDL